MKDRVFAFAVLAISVACLAGAVVGIAATQPSTEVGRYSCHAPTGARYNDPNPTTECGRR